RAMAKADAAAGALLAQTAGVTDGTKVAGLLVNAGKALLGSEFVILPLWRYHNETDVLASHGHRDQLLSYAKSKGMDLPAEEWMQNAAQVRPRLARWDYVRMLAETMARPLPVAPVQLPYRSKDSWLAVEFPATDPNVPPGEPNDPPKPFTLSN